MKKNFYILGQIWGKISYVFFSKILHSTSCMLQFSSVQFSRSVMSDSLRPREPKHARPPCPSPTPGVHPDSRPSSQWCHPAISSSVVPFSSCPQSLPTSESFPMSQLFAWGGQSTGVAASASFPPKKSQGWSPSEWTGWISLYAYCVPYIHMQCIVWVKRSIKHIKLSLVAQMVKNLPARWETQIRSLGWEDPLEKEMAIHSNILAWRIPWTEGSGGL